MNPNRLKRYNDWYKPLLPKSGFSLLDLGCGAQNHTQYFPFGSCTAVDANERYRTLVSKKAKFICIDVLDFLLLSHESFDVVVALDVLEHLDKKIAEIVIDRMQYCCNDIVIIKVPDGLALNPEINQEDKLQIHRCGFTQEELETFDFTVRRLTEDRLSYKPKYERTNTPFPKSWDNLVAYWKLNDEA